MTQICWWLVVTWCKIWIQTWSKKRSSPHLFDFHDRVHKADPKQHLQDNTHTKRNLWSYTSQSPLVFLKQHALMLKKPIKSSSLSVKITQINNAPMHNPSIHMIWSGTCTNISILFLKKKLLLGLSEAVNCKILLYSALEVNSGWV